MSLVPSDLQGGIWDRRLNRGVTVLRVISNVDPQILNIAPTDWRSLVRTACRLWEPSGVVAFIVSFAPKDTLPDQAEGTVTIKLHESPESSWNGYTNNWTEWKNHLTQSALVWLDPDLAKGVLTDITREQYAQWVVCHELGHVLGFAHRSDSVMAIPGMMGHSLTPTSGDIAKLAELYS